MAFSMTARRTAPSIGQFLGKIFKSGSSQTLPSQPKYTQPPSSDPERTESSGGWTADNIMEEEALPIERERVPRKKIRVYGPPPGAPVKTAIDLFTKSEISKLDPSGLRTRLFSRKVKDSIKPGDIIQVRFKDPNVEPFAGVLLNIRRRGLDTGILLRNQVTRIAVEMWYKVYSPLIEGFDMVQKRDKRARRAKLYHMRKEKHDIGSVEGIVKQWKRSKSLFSDQGTNAANRNKSGAGAFKKKQYKPAAVKA